MCGAGGCFPWAGGASGCGLGWLTSPPGGAGCAAWKCGRRGVKCAPGAGKVMVNAKLRMDNWELVKRCVAPKTCVILSGAKRNRRIFRVPKRKKVQDPSARAFGAAQDDAGFRLFVLVGGGTKSGAFRADVGIGPYGGAGRISDYRRVTPKTCVILSGTKWSRRIFYVSKRNHAQDPSARAFGAAQDDAGFRLFAWVGRGSKVGAFRADVPQSAPTVGPYSVTVGAVINRPGGRRVPSTGRWIRTGTWRAIGDRPYGGAFGLGIWH